MRLDRYNSPTHQLYDPKETEKVVSKFHRYSKKLSQKTISENQIFK